jgi:hypothetical protein
MNTVTIIKNLNQPNTRVWIAKDIEANEPSNIADDVLAGLLEKLMGDNYQARYISRNKSKVFFLDPDGKPHIISYDQMVYNSVDLGICVGFYLRGSVDEGQYDLMGDEYTCKNEFASVKSFQSISFEEL